jgi:ribosome-associated protein
MNPPGRLLINAHLAIPLDEIELSFSTSGGPGGQHANRAATKVEARFDVERSAALGPRQRQRLLDVLGPIVRTTAADDRSQMRNRELALERMAVRLSDALRVPKARVATRQSRAAKERRIEQKRQRANVKRMRARPTRDE